MHACNRRYDQAHMTLSVWEDACCLRCCDCGSESSRLKYIDKMRDLLTDGEKPSHKTYLSNEGEEEEWPDGEIDEAIKKIADEKAAEEEAKKEEEEAKAEEEKAKAEGRPVKKEEEKKEESSCAIM